MKSTYFEGRSNASDGTICHISLTSAMKISARIVDVRLIRSGDGASLSSRPRILCYTGDKEKGIRLFQRIPRYLGCQGI